MIRVTESGDVPGTIRRFDVTHCPLAVPTFGKSTHAFGLAEAVGLSRALHQLPHELIIYGVEGQDLGPGTTRPVTMESAVNNVVERVLQEF